MYKPIFLVLVLLLTGGFVQADDPTSVMAAAGPGHSLLISYDQAGMEDIDHWKLYYATPFDPDNWIGYKGNKKYKKWEIINEVGSPHQCSMHVAYCPDRYIGWIILGVTAVNNDGEESDKVVAAWREGDGGLVVISGGFEEWGADDGEKAEEVLGTSTEESGTGGLSIKKP